MIQLYSPILKMLKIFGAESFQAQSHKTLNVSIFFNLDAPDTIQRPTGALGAGRFAESVCSAPPHTRLAARSFVPFPLQPPPRELENLAAKSIMARRGRDDDDDDEMEEEEEDAYDVDEEEDDEDDYEEETRRGKASRGGGGRKRSREDNFIDDSAIEDEDDDDDDGRGRPRKKGGGGVRGFFDEEAQVDEDEEEEDDGEGEDGEHALYLISW
jgi:hypothetical protein